MRKFFKFVKRLIFIVILLSLAVTGFAGYRIWQYAKVDETREADCAIVLGYALENGEATQVFRERIDQGCSLFLNNQVKYLIFTGGVGEGDEISEAMVAKNYAIKKFNIPEECIYIEENSHSTEENMEYAREIMAQKNLKTALLVSDPLHMKRAMLMAGDYGITAYSAPTPDPAYEGSKSEYYFLAREAVLYVYYSAIRIFR